MMLLATAPAILDAQLPTDELAQLTIHQRIVIRLPRPADPQMEIPSRPMRWHERKAPRCVPVGAIVGAAFSRDDSVDLVVEDGARLRARFKRGCPTIGFYSGIYLKPTPDGMLCARRDVLRSRSGDACRVDDFRLLVRRP